MSRFGHARTNRPCRARRALIRYVLARYELMLTDSVGWRHFTSMRFWRRSAARRQAAEMNEGQAPGAPVTEVYDRWVGW